MGWTPATVTRGRLSQRSMGCVSGASMRLEISAAVTGRIASLTSPEVSAVFVAKTRFSKARLSGSMFSKKAVTARESAGPVRGSAGLKAKPEAFQSSV